MPKTTWMQHAVKIFGRISWCALQLWHDITQYMYYIYGAKILKVERRSCVLFCLLSDCRNGGRSKNLRGNNIVKNGWDGAKRLDQWITYIVLGCLFFLLGGGRGHYVLKWILWGHTLSPWLTRIRFTRISLTRIFKKFPFLT